MRITGVLCLAAAILVIAPVLMAAEGERGLNTAKFSGKVTAGGGTTLTVTRKTGGERAPVDESKSFVVNATETKVFIETDQMESVPGEGGKMKQRPKIVEGAVEDLKAGQRVAVACNEDASKALKILVQRVVAKGGRESDRIGEEPAPRKPDGGEKPAPRKPDGGEKPAPRKPEGGEG